MHFITLCTLPTGDAVVIEGLIPGAIEIFYISLHGQIFDQQIHFYVDHSMFLTLFITNVTLEQQISDLL